jgi:hypothetical protein
VRLAEGGQAVGHRGDERPGVARGLQVLDPERLPGEVAEHHGRAARSHVHGGGEPVGGAHVQVRRPPAAGGRPLGAGDDDAVGEELVDEGRDLAAPHAQAARDVDARDRLVLAHEVQHDLPVDVPRRAAPGEPGAGGVDFPHALRGGRRTTRRGDVALRAGGPEG